MKFCMFCGQELPDAAGFCFKCGKEQKVEKTTPAEMNIEAVASAVAVGKTCPYCQFTIKPGEETIVCDQCGMAHHVQCWKENGDKCTTFGCSEDKAVVADPVAPEIESISNCKPWYKRTWLYVVVVFVLFIVLAVNFGQRPADYEMSARDFMKSYYDLGESSFNLRYKEKTINLTGIVFAKGQYSNSEDFYLDLSDARGEDVLVGFSAGSAGDINRVKVGDAVKVQGIGVGRVRQSNGNISLHLAKASILKY
ncbi:MAG: RING finger protein [Bacillota bacterium]